MLKCEGGKKDSPQCVWMPELTKSDEGLSEEYLGNDTGKVDWCYIVAGFKGPTGTFRFCCNDNAEP